MTTNDPALPRPAGAKTPASAVFTLIGVSIAASVLICWLVYFHAPTDVSGTHLRSLPLVNAIANGCSTIALLFGLFFILRKEIARHRASMFTAFFFSSIFLASYLVNFTLHGETKFDRLNHWWPIYWKILASHIVLSMFALPMILITFFLSLTGRFPAHKKLARWTLPIWLYVSITGVVIYLLQAAVH